MDPYLKPFYDNLEQLIKNKEPKEDLEQIRIAIDDLLIQGKIEIQPMSSIRGRTFTNSYIIIDEAQNTSAKQIETLITRLGDGSKIVILGDLNQIDTSKLSRYSNGLAVCSDRMRGSKYTAQISYLDADVKRSKLAKDAVERFRR
jgi:PhoH-like ATPase